MGRTQPVRARGQLPQGSGDLGQPLLDTADLTQLSDAELQRLAQSWRAQALRGVRKANGPAHAFEAVLRGRQAGGQLRAEDPTLDLRPVAQWDPPRPWWKFW